MKFSKKKIFIIISLIAASMIIYNFSRGLYVCSQQPIHSLQKATDIDINFKIPADLRTIDVLRGVPSCSWHTKDFWMHVFLRNKKQIHGHLFNAEAIEKSKIDYESIKQLICDSGNYGPFSGETMAGVNQASLYLRWIDQGAIIEIISSDETDELYVYINGIGKRYSYSREFSRKLKQQLLSDVIIKL